MFVKDQCSHVQFRSVVRPQCEGTGSESLSTACRVIGIARSVLLLRQRGGPGTKKLGVKSLIIKR